MKDDIIYSIDEDLYHVVPIIFRKLLKIEQEDILQDISRHHMDIMRMLHRLGTLPVSKIGRRLLISKPQMTHLIDKLIKLEMVQRLPDETDRRIVNIKLTRKGEKVLEERRDQIRENIRKKLACLKDDELQAFSISLRSLRDIGSKLE